MRGSINKLISGCVLSLLMLVSSAGYAGMNPFKKSKNYTFGSDVSWYEHNNAAIKSGSVRDGSDTNYYHLNIDNSRLMLRMGKNDPSGELENTRLLNNMSVSEVKLDGRRLPLFNWCLENQQNPSKELKQNAVVANDVCINAGGGGDFIINLDDQSKTIFKNAKSLEFIVKPYGRPVKLTYSMPGYAPIMAEINKPIAPPPPPPVVKKATPKPVVVAKPKPVKKCYASAPDGFKSAIPAISYPCNDKVKKSDAESKISSRVKQEKNKRQEKLRAAENDKQLKQKSAEDDKREAEWDDKQSSIWISRCEKHWANNRSPCFCEKYLSRAPAGVNNTCGR